jgi:DNA-binding XRE family transcriptional regulator
MLGERLRQLREAGGLTQTALAARAGVSRQLVGAVEAGRHLPRVDAAASLAAALDTTVESLLGRDRTTTTEPVPVVDEPPGHGTPVRLGRVGDRLVCAPAPVDWDGWASADGLVAEHGVEPLDSTHRPGVVVVGCDPALALAARLVGDRSGEQVLAVAASSAAAMAAIAASRTHAAVVHGPAGELPAPPVPVRRWRLSSWQVGLAAPTDAPAGWTQQALEGRIPVIRREPGAGAQAAFERAASGLPNTEGPLVGGHLEAAWLAARTGSPAVTIEPAARATGLAFHALETHVAELWVDQRWSDEPALQHLGDAITSSTFARRLAAIGGYDLTGCGTPVTA